jgi:ribosomal protein S18 acetylase RimI-like enzyme
MNMLYLLEPHRGKGGGKQLVDFWEGEMKNRAYKVILTSAAQDEYAQHFYVKLGYKAIGSFTLDNDPLEIMFAKRI